MFKGSIVALITPFINDQIDEAAFVRLLNWHVDQGTEAVVVCGSTGESFTLRRNEQARLIELAVKTIAGRIPVIAGTAAIDTAQTIELTQQAESLKADGVLIITPPYIKPSQEGLYQYYKAIAENTALPIILYNNPTRTAVTLEVETVVRLASISNIVGLKDATQQLERATLIRAAVGPDFCLMGGEDALVAGYLAQGGSGSITCMANVAPKLCAQMVRAWHDRDMDTFTRMRDQLVPLSRSLFVETNPCPVKYAMSLLGFCEAGLRSPLQSVNENSKQQILSTMKALGLVA